MLNASRVRDQAPRCGQVLGIGAAKRLALEHLAGGKALAHDQTPSLSTRVSEVVQCVLWCAQSKVNMYLLFMIKARIRWCTCRVENILTLGKLLSLWFCFLLHSILFLISQTSYRTYKNNFKL